MSITQGSYTAAIAVSPNHVGEEVSKNLFGAIQRWVRNGEHAADPETGKVYDQIVEACQIIGVTDIRYGAGNLSGQGFLFDRLIGPMENRTWCYNLNGTKGFPPIYGPDEAGDLCTQLKADISLVLNFHRSNVQEQLNYVSYMIHPSNGQKVDIYNIATYKDKEYYDPQYWGNLRASIGRAEPYSLKLVTVGNEEGVDNHGGWYSGELVEVGEHPDDVMIDFNDPTCVKTALYVWGGTVRFTKQAVATYADLDEEASTSSGKPNQEFYAYYRHINEGTAIVYVDDVEWKVVDCLSSAGPNDQVCTLECHFGKIIFGDGKHGAIPAKGAKITLSCESTHKGYVDYYKAIKALYPEIIVGSNVCRIDPFFKVIGKSTPYEVAQNIGLGLYEPSRGDKPFNEMLFYQNMVTAENQADKVNEIRERIRSTGKEMKVHMTAWNRNNGFRPQGTGPDWQINFATAMLTANQLYEYMMAGIEHAYFFQLNNAPWNPVSGGHVDPGTYSALITSVNGEEAIISPKGWAFSMFSRMAGKKLVETVVDGPILPIQAVNALDPKYCDPNETPVNKLNLLKAATAMDENGNMLMVVINNSFTDNCRATVHLDGFEYDSIVEVTTLNADSFYDQNSPETPNKVRPVTKKVDLGGNHFEYIFPAHSVTSIVFNKPSS
ncbi:alpha-L-arabinofuranosidase C-terminal domain-containing protein [Paenibacillus sp.]|uniref:alpha-L-arabinofuranosidase C-terminal domain-containing protein n=1 Tax=Paenibacillus sp. TaxID=58172 RepID=UPI002D233440|nr:alpha-L-arabinofuranosidase C-terminal domain-containing protein [Paenibacillus sp.]HZG84039.1 alpha-L-arabinofuranosidase C-terminal domain-containing protein [Paenibacillus sp.]